MTWVRIIKEYRRMMKTMKVKCPKCQTIRETHYTIENKRVRCSNQECSYRYYTKNNMNEE